MNTFTVLASGKYSYRKSTDLKVLQPFEDGYCIEPCNSPQRTQRTRSVEAKFFADFAFSAVGKPQSTPGAQSICKLEGK